MSDQRLTLLKGNNVALTNEEWEVMQSQWKAKEENDRSDGIVCYRCGSYIVANLIRPPGHKSLCPDCHKMDCSHDEVTSSNFIRCPKCLSQHKAFSDSGDYGILEEGENSFICDSCDHEFEVETIITYKFKSPAVIREDESEEDEVED